MTPEEILALTPNQISAAFERNKRLEQELTEVQEEHSKVLTAAVKMEKERDQFFVELERLKEIQKQGDNPRIVVDFELVLSERDSAQAGMERLKKLALALGAQRDLATKRVDELEKELYRATKEADEYEQRYTITKQSLERAEARAGVMRKALEAINKLPGGATVEELTEIRFQAINKAFKAICELEGQE